MLERKLKYKLMGWIYDIYSIENWIKNHWIILIFILIISVLVIAFTLWLIIKVYKYITTKNKIKKIWKNETFSKTNLVNTFINDLNIKFWQFEIKKVNNDKKIAWHAIVGILTRVIANKYDEVYGNPREALRSLYTFYNELREEIKKYPLAFKSNIVILAFMNNELRPFLTKWNFLLNEKYKITKDKTESKKTRDTYIHDFIKDFNSMYDSIIKNQYIENLLFILGWNVNTNNLTIPDGVENIKKNNIPEEIDYLKTDEIFI